MARLYFDIESIPDQGEGALDRARDNIKVPASYKKPETIAQYIADHTENVWSKTALQGISGEICSIAWAIDDEHAKSLTRGLDVGIDTETSLLEAFFAAVKETALPGEGGHQRLEWIGHNLIDFDLRFIKQRALILCTPPGIYLPSEARHGKGGVFDTMREWCGFRNYVKQSELQEAFNIPVDETLAIGGGDEVNAFWTAGRFDDIAKYNRDDVRVCRAIHKRLTWS